jgi:hypothetical protein
MSSKLNAKLKATCVHIFMVLGLSALLVGCASKPPAETPDMQAEYESCARTLTRRILDTNYNSYFDSTAALLEPTRGNLTVEVIRIMQLQGILPRDRDELEAKKKLYTDTHRISDFSIGEVKQSKPDPNNGLVTIDVTGLLSVRTISDPNPKSNPFHFRYVMKMDEKSKKPIVTGFLDLSNMPTLK